MVQGIGKKLNYAIGKQTEKVGYFCNEENTLPNIGVQETRKAFKRIRALLHFFPASPDNFISESIIHFKEYGQRISPLRESYINIQLFDKIAESRLIPERKTKSIKELLVQKNKQFLVNWKEGERLNAEINQFVDDFNTTFKIKKFEVTEKILFRNEVINSYLNAFDFFEQLELNCNGDEWHELRKKMKRLWYQLDFAKFLHPRYLKLKADQLNGITEQLGEEHDLFVFYGFIEKEKLDLDAYEKVVLCNKIEHLRQIVQVKLTTKLRQFFNETPIDFEKKIDKIFESRH
jgi:CHAD domain-containing protein